MNHLGLFEGIGGFSLAARWAGWKTPAWVEIDDFCQSVLKKHFSDAKGYSDIKKFNGNEWRGKIDIITGGFPCQPFSVNGKQKAKDDDRYLWDEMLRVINEVKPEFVLGENVTGLVKLALDDVWTSLEDIGYSTEAYIIPACAKNAKHRRDRVWILSYAKGSNNKRKAERLEAQKKKPQEQINGVQFDCEMQNGGQSRGRISESELLRTLDGVPSKLDKARLKALGNAIYPPIAYEFFKSINTIKSFDCAIG